jgi:hypothetical protein
VTIPDHAQVGPSLTGVQVGDVGEPGQVPLTLIELPLDQVRKRGTGRRSGPWSAGLLGAIELCGEGQRPPRRYLWFVGDWIVPLPTAAFVAEGSPHMQVCVDGADECVLMKSAPEKEVASRPGECWCTRHVPHRASRGPQQKQESG